jgi:hypothetical protein
LPSREHFYFHEQPEINNKAVVVHESFPHKKFTIDSLSAYTAFEKDQTGF